MPSNNAMSSISSGQVGDVTGEIGARITRAGGWAITAALSVIFLWFGSLKFIPAEQQDLVGIVANNPLTSWLYSLFGVGGGAEFLGVFELTTGLLIACRIVDPRLSSIGGAMGAWSFCLTLSCLFTTPGVIEKGYEGTPVISASPGGFLLKDIVLLAGCLWLLGTSLSEASSRRRRA
jgi:uncharacterized membrane protein YkgB